jgi:quercetin dioxygenase-like cupin family protein
MSQIVNISALPNFYAMGNMPADAADSERIDLRTVFGHFVSIGVAECKPGYHPAPQIHASEQINYIAEGELWVYIEGVPFLLKQGDAIRVPRMKMHWMWNRSSQPCKFYESNCPPLIGDPAVRNSPSALFDESQPKPQGDYPQVVWLARKYADEAEKAAGSPCAESPLLARASSLTTSVHSGAIGAAASGKLTSKCVHGLQHNLTLATRKGGYHSVPHIHDAEQIHFLVKGEIKIFTSEFGYDCKPGDFNITPRNIPHWAHVPTDDENILLQVHSPVLGSAANRKALIAEEERIFPIPTVFNMTPYGAEEIMKVEERFRGTMRRSGT